MLVEFKIKGGKKVAVNPKHISAVQELEDQVRIFIVGEQEPWCVDNISYQKVIEKINE
jgi:uncharacterized protein YlzI (FlbEa/FlbD family)